MKSTDKILDSIWSVILVDVMIALALFSGGAWQKKTEKRLSAEKYAKRKIGNSKTEKRTTWI